MPSYRADRGIAHRVERAFLLLGGPGHLSPSVDSHLRRPAEAPRRSIVACGRLWNVRANSRSARLVELAGDKWELCFQERQ